MAEGYGDDHPRCAAPSRCVGRGPEASPDRPLGCRVQRLLQRPEADGRVPTGLNANGVCIVFLNGGSVSGTRRNGASTVRHFRNLGYAYS